LIKIIKATDLRQLFFFRSTISLEILSIKNRSSQHLTNGTMNKLIYTLLFLSFLSCKNQSAENKTKPILTDITETVYASINIKPALSYFPQPIRAGVIKEIWVKEGDEVKKGQKLFQISIPAETESRLSNAQLNLEEAKANYNGSNNLLLNIELEIRSAQQQMLLDSTNLKRIERLWSQNIGKKVDYESAKLSYNNSQNKLEILYQKKAQTLVNLENNYKKALNQTKTEHSQSADYTIHSEIDGIVYTLNKEVGDFISSQERFSEIGSESSFVINMDIDEVDITKIELKDTVMVNLDAYPDKIFIASVNKIYPKKNEATQTFQVEGLFIPPAPKLYNGLSGEANILVDKRKNVIVIPSDYLLPENKVSTPDGIVSVKVGIKNLDFVEILGGIDTSITLIKSTD
jgi:multidrug efflux pump subunit AcrA (membrane-fusion protein)